MKILTLTNYDLVFTTSFAYKHGVSGHLYELIDYYYVCSTNGLKCAILLSDGVTKEVFLRAIKDKYNFTEDELSNIELDTIECFQPRIIRSKNICLVDGSWRVGSCTIYADNAFLLRCSEDDFTYWATSKSVKRSHVMQDFKLYPERFENLNVSVVDYIKKILWGKYKHPTPVKTGTGLLYLTTNCRSIDIDAVERIINKGDCDNYLILTNKPEVYKEVEASDVRVVQAPIKDIFEQFDTYIYTPTDLQADCSPRFIVECALYGKQVVYEIDYVCEGIERRKEAIENDLSSLELTADDYFIKYVKEQLSV